MKVHKKTLILNIFVIVAVLFSIVYVNIVGKHYSMNTFVSVSDGKPVFKVELDREGVVEIERTYVKDGMLTVDLKAIGEGDANAVVYIKEDVEDDFTPAYERSLKVTSFGTIVESTHGIVNFNGFRAVIAAILFVLALTEIFTLLRFAVYRRKGMFSYSMVAEGGAAIYVLILMMFLIYKIFNNVVDSFGAFLNLVTEAGHMLIVALIPVMFVISVRLVFSNFWLMRHEGVRPVNALGIAFGLVWLVGMVLTVGPLVLSDDFARMIWLTSWVRQVLICIVAYFECMFLSTILCAYMASKYTPPYDRDYIIILGCGIRSDGSLTPLLRGRVDSAVAFEKAQFDSTGKHAFFVPSGGRGADEIISESEAMSRYLKSAGIPAERILREDKSVNTFENMKLSKAVIEADGGDIADKKVAFSTTNYHVFRGYILAKENGFDAKGISAKTKSYFFPNAFLREFIGLLVDKKRVHLIYIILIIIAFFAISVIG